MFTDFFNGFILFLVEDNLVLLEQVSPVGVNGHDQSGPNSCTLQVHSVSGIPRSFQLASSISSTVAAATTAHPAGNTQCSALNSLQPFMVPSFIPPFPTISFTPVSRMNSYSNFSHSHTGRRSYRYHLILVFLPFYRADDRPRMEDSAALQIHRQFSSSFDQTSMGYITACGNMSVQINDISDMDIL